MLAFLFWVGMAIGAAAVIFLLGTTIYAGILSAPFVGTPRKCIRRALQECRLQKGEQFYDLGSGDGRALLIAAKEFGARGTGFELSYLLYLVSKIAIFFNCINGSVIVHWANFYNEGLADADVVFCWLTPRAFPGLEEKFNKELRVGTRVATFSSPLVFWEPYQVIDCGGSKLFLYKRQKNKPSN